MGDSEETLDSATLEQEGSTSALSSSDQSQEDSGQPAEPADNRERSRLGRSVAELRREVESQKGILSRIEQLLDQRQYHQAIPQQEDEFSDPDKLLTVGEFERYQARKEQRIREQQSRYSNDYIRTVHGLYASGGDLHSEITQELLTNVQDYPTHTDHADPVRDATINYRLAKAAVIERKYAKPSPKPNVRGGETRATGVTTETRQAAPQRKIVPLDEPTAKFARAMGLSEDDEFVQKSVTREDLA